MAEQESMYHPSGLPETKVSGEECGNGSPLGTLDSYLNAAEECVEEVQKLMPSRKFNTEQCEYLADKLNVVVGRATLFLEVSRAEQHGPRSSVDIAKCVEIFKLLLGLAKQVESFVQGCCKHAWIQAAMTLTNVSEYVSSVGFNLELCKVAFSKESAASGRATLDQVDAINKIEVEIVEKKVSADVVTLLAKVASELNYLPSENRDLAGYLLQRLLRVQPNPAAFTSGSSLWCVNDDGSFLGKLFKWVKPAERLGNGSSAIVHKAMWLGTPVAKKTYYGPEDPEFMKEVGILSRLCHPNITSMFCYAKDKRSCSILMELMDEDLYTLMQRRLDGNSDAPPFTILEAVDIMLQIGEGVNYLHNKRIVHRDLKALNILVKGVKGTQSETGYVHVKVADFGLSKTKESSTRYSNLTCNTGTTRWMAPEIINLHNVGSEARTSRIEKVPKYPFKCDVYSFAMVCCEILSGAVPFATISNPKTVKENVMRGERPDLPNDCPPKLKVLIEKCWNQEPWERPSFAYICSELKYLKFLLLTGFNQGPHLTVEEPLQPPTVETPWHASANIKPGLTMMQVCNSQERYFEECAKTGNTEGIDHGGRVSEDTSVLGKRGRDDPSEDFGLEPVRKLSNASSSLKETAFQVIPDRDDYLKLVTPSRPPSSSFAIASPAPKLVPPSGPESSSFAIPSPSNFCTRDQYNDETCYREREVRFRENLGKYVVEYRPPGFKWKLWLGTYATVDEGRRAWDCARFYADLEKGGFLHFKDSPALFWELGPLNRPFTLVSEDIRDKAFNVEIKKRAKQVIRKVLEAQRA